MVDLFMIGKVSIYLNYIFVSVSYMNSCSYGMMDSKTIVE